jgi:cell division protein FtsN
VAATGDYKIQLGAYKSQAEADSNWARISRKYVSALDGKSHIVVKADLPNGTYYRLRASGYASPEAAKQACSALSAQGQASFYAGK